MNRIISKAIEIKLHPNMNREDRFSLSKSWKTFVSGGPEKGTFLFFTPIVPDWLASSFLLPGF
jgi:hypothetical protein